MVHEHLFRGRENARQARELARLLHCDVRTITAAVSRERLAGWPICSESQGKHAGYYLAANEAERTKCCRSLAGRAKEIFTACNALKQSSLDGPQGSEQEKREFSDRIRKESRTMKERPEQ